MADEATAGAAAGSNGIPEPYELVARARALTPVLRERQQAAEARRGVPPESIDQMRDAELYKVLQPRRFGGFEHGFDSFLDVTMEIAGGCGSTGWVYATASECQWMIGMFPPAAQDEVWGEDPRAVAASSLNPSGLAVPVDGGWRLSGGWTYCAGIDNCQWMILAARTASDGEAEPSGQGYALVRVTDCTIEDNWHVSGLAATGSKNAACADAFVPSHRFLPLEDALSGHPPGAAAHPGPLYRIPLFAALSVGRCAAVLGMARGAYAVFVDGTRSRATRGAAMSRPAAMAELPTIQLHTAEAAADIDAARLLVRRDCRDIMATVAAGDALTVEQRARNKGDLGLAARLARQAADQLYFAAGGAGIHDDNPLQRFWRDIHAGGMDVSMNWDAAAILYGRVSLGLPPGPAQF